MFEAMFQHVECWVRAQCVGRKELPGILLVPGAYVTGMLNINIWAANSIQVRLLGLFIHCIHYVD